MSLHDDIKTVLSASSTLTTAFPGGIYTWDNTGGLGLSRANAMVDSAFDTNKALKRTIVIKERDLLRSPQIAGESEQTTSAIQAVEIWFYCDRTDQAGIAVCKTGQATVYGLLADRHVSAQFMRFREHRRSQRDLSLDNAFAIASVYDAYSVLTP